MPDKSVTTLTGLELEAIKCRVVNAVQAEGNLNQDCREGYVEEEESCEEVITTNSEAESQNNENTRGMTKHRPVK